MNKLNEDFDYDIEDMRDPDGKADILIKYKKKFINIFSILNKIFDKEWPELWDDVDFASIDRDDASYVKDRILNTIGRIIKKK